MGDGPVVVSAQGLPRISVRYRLLWVQMQNGEKSGSVLVRLGLERLMKSMTCHERWLSKLQLSSLQNQFFAGISMDRKKLFDLFNYQLGHCLMEADGRTKSPPHRCKTCILISKCCYKLREAASEPFQEKNWFTQFFFANCSHIFVAVGIV